MDVLTDLLERSRARGAAFACSTLHGRAGLRFPVDDGIAVKVFVAGEADLWSDDGRSDGPLTLLPGDVVLMRCSTEHRIVTDPDAGCTMLADSLAAGPTPGTSRQYRIGDPAQPATANFVCGAYRFEGDLCNELLASLPDLFRLRPPTGSTLRAVLDLLAREIDFDGPGQQTTLDRLLDVALVHILREHLTSQAADAPKWFPALADPRIGPALRALHAEPAGPWTVGALAAESGLSRAAFARHFTALLGASPVAYLTDWRMSLAREQLRRTDDSIDAVARAVGYRSEYSFAAAFKRHHGIAPGRWRRRTPTRPGLNGAGPRAGAQASHAADP